MGAIEHPPIFRLPGIPDHVTYTWIVMAILIGVAFAASRNVAWCRAGRRTSSRSSSSSSSR